MSIFETPNIDQVATGENLKHLRKKANISVKTVADFFCGDVSCSAIYGWEKGNYLPEISKLIALGCFYGGYTLNDLIVLTDI